MSDPRPPLCGLCAFAWTILALWSVAFGAWLLLAPSLGANPRGWKAEVSRQGLEADRARWDAVCKGPRP